MQSFEEYRKDFLEDTRATEQSEGNGTVASFVKLCALKLFEGDVIPEYTPCYYNGKYKNSILRVDGFAHDERDGILYMLVASYSGAQECENLIGSDAKNMLSRCRAFAANSLEYDLASKIEMSTVAYDLASYIDDQAKFISKFVIILITDMSLSERAVLEDDQPKGRKKATRVRTSILKADDICGIEVEYRIWDMQRFYRLFGVGDGKQTIEIDFNEYIEGGIPCLPANTLQEKAECISYLCTMPGNVLADLYDRYGSRILEGNVRSFLGRKGNKKSVNNQIRNTVLNEPDRFFVYNNGLSTTAIDVVVENGKLLHAKDLQIVNGGQTTASLAAARKIDNADLSQIFVLMKLTQVPTDTASEIVPLISRSANSQNQIKAADFFSTHEYHIRMEQISRRKFAPAKDGAQHETHWFYERARGQYIQATMNLTKAQEKKFMTQNPKDQVVTKTDLAKVLSAWDQFPHIVSKGAESNFDDFAKRTEEQWEKKRDDFNDNYFQDAMALVILYRTVDKMIPKQPWYEGGYKANIVAYSVALLRHLMKGWYPDSGLDLQKIWNKQKCSDVLVLQMSQIAEAVYKKITSDTRPVENVTQWCKQAACWEEVKRIKLLPVAGFYTVLIGKTEQTAVKREARDLRKIDNSIDAQTTVLDLGEVYWKKLDDWLRSHRLATEAEQRALKVAIKISRGYFPDERQCKNLMNLRAKAVREGFPEKLK